MSRRPAPFPWDEVLAFALGVLRWTPDAVWRATPREIAAASGVGLHRPALATADLHGLMARFPDTERT